MNTILPCHPHPKTDELFSSWLVRLCLHMGIKLHTFTKLVVPHHQVWNRDIDRSAPAAMLYTLSQQTGLPFEVLYHATLQSYEGFVFEKNSYIGVTPLLCSVGIWHRKRKNYALSFCPACLYESKHEPYFKRNWRLVVSTCCFKHKLQLLDSCQSCQAPITFHRHDFFNKGVPSRQSIASCSNCRAMLYACDWKKEKEPDFLLFQQKLDSMLESGWTQTGSAPVPSILYLKVVRQLMRIFSSQTANAQILHELYSRSTGFLHLIPQSNEIESMRLTGRKSALRATLWLLNDWPEHFSKIYKDSGIPREFFVHDLDRAPFWLEKVLKKI